jgi:MYXO-CTERM domain-containing protein
MFRRAYVAIVGLVVWCVAGAFEETPTTIPASNAPAAVNRSPAIVPHRFGNLPLRFEANAGQWDPGIRFVARDHGATLFITDEAMTIGLRDVKMPPNKASESRQDEQKERERAFGKSKGAAVTMKLVGVHSRPPMGEKPLVTKSNFFLGNNPAKWRTNVPNFAEVRADEWLPGVAVSWRGGPDGLEYDLDVTAGADASRIAFDIKGANALHVGADGTLEIVTRAGTLLQRPPRVVQGGKELRTRYRLEGSERVGFEIEGYDRTSAILIDPILGYSSYLGGSGGDIDYPNCIAVDTAGAAYVTGGTNGSFPVTNGAEQVVFAGGYDTFVAKLNPSGSALVYATYLGGSGLDYGNAIAIDSSGDAYVAGQTTGNLPTTNGAYQKTYAGGEDAFVAKLDASGSALVYSTYLGGSGSDYGYGIAVDANNEAHVMGGTNGSFPTTNGAYQTTYGGGSKDVFLTTLDAAGSALVYSTYVGGSGLDYPLGFAIDSNSNAYVTGFTTGSFPVTLGAYQTTFGGGANDAFVTKLNASGSALVYSTYLGGSAVDSGYGIAVDSTGDAYCTGSTTGSFPTTVGAYQTTFGGTQDAYVTKLNASGAALVYSTYLGGAGTDLGYGIAVDSSGNANLTGDTTGSFPTTNGAYQTTYGGAQDAFFAQLDASGASLAYSTYLGGSGTEYGYSIAVDGSGNPYCAGQTTGSFPTTNGAYQTTYGGMTDTFVAKFGPLPLTLSPSSAIVVPKGSQTFTASGGSGGGYNYTLQTNSSGGSINASTGAYTAGPTGSVTDVVEVTDSANHTATGNVTVGPAVSVSPASPMSPPKGTLTFSASGGSGSGHTFALTTNASGGSINSSTGDYAAGASANVSDTVTVTDSLGNTGSTAVSVGPGVSISPSNPAAPPNGSIAFTAVGGSGTGFTWSIATNNSGGTINASTGAYVAGSQGNVGDTVAVADSLGNTASLNVSVGGGLAINPAAPSTPPKGSIAFVVTGGSGSGFTWSLKTNASGGTIDPSSGAYAAGPTPNVTDVVAITDSLNNTSSVNVTVTAGVSINPTTATLAPNATATFAAAGGSGKGYTWSVAANASGGNITSAGVYTAGATGNATDTVQLVDSLGNSATATITVVAGPPAAPSSGGCGCKAAGHSSSPSTLGAISVLAGLALLRRRRKRVEAEDGRSSV